MNMEPSRGEAVARALSPSPTAPRMRKAFRILYLICLAFAQLGRAFYYGIKVAVLGDKG